MAAPGVAVPGSVVAIGSQVSPAGPQGIQGSAGPSAVSANANNKATLGSDSLILVQGTAAGIAATTHAQTVSGDDPQLTNARTPTAHHTTHEHGGSDLVSVTYSDLLSIPTTFAPAAHEVSHVTGSDQIPLASASTKGLLNQTSGNTTDFIDGTNNSQALQPVIWSARLRSLNALGNPAMDIDQISGSVVGPQAAGKSIDRWTVGKVGTMAVSCGRADAPGFGVTIPGTNFAISRGFHRIQLTTAQATLAAGDALYMVQNVEGPRFRELSSDLHSIQILCRSTVANLKFAISIRDAGGPPATKSLLKLCTLGAANTWSLIQLPNLPLWDSGGTFSANPGTMGYTVMTCLAAGSTFIAPAADTWQSGNFFGAPGMSNFANNSVGSQFDVAFISHEPGNQCSNPPLDCPWQQAYDDCLRYYQKTYPYNTVPGTVTGSGQKSWLTLAGGAAAFGPTTFIKPMAKQPTVTLYNAATGAAGSIRDGAATDHSGATASNPADNGFFSIGFTTTIAAANYIFGHYVADTGW